MNSDLVTFLDALPNPVVLNRKNVDDQGKPCDTLFYTNRLFRQIIGYSPEEIPNEQVWFETAYPDKEYQAIVMKAWNKALAEAREKQSSLIGFPAKVTCKDAQERWFHFMTHLDYPIGGEYKIITMMEIPSPESSRIERDQAVLELTREKEFLKTLINILPARIFWKDRESRYLGCNNLFAKDASLKDEQEIIGKSDYDMPWHDQADLYVNDDTAVMATGEKRINYVEPQSHADGSMIVLQTSKVPILNAAGETVGVLGTYSDITEEANREAELKASKEAFETLFQKANDPILLIENERFFDCNDAAVAILGATSKEEVIHALPGDLSPEFQSDGRNSYEKSHEMTGKAVKEGMNHFEWTHKRFNGEMFIVDVVLTRITIGGRQIIHVAWRDITEETRLRKAERNRFVRNEFYLKALFEWSKVDYDDAHKAIRSATEIAANMLGVGRVSVWLFDDEEASLTCSDLYIAAEGHHSSGYVLKESDYPVYFSNLKHGYVMAVEDARRDSRTYEFRESYLIPNRIHSMLDIPVVQAGRVLGVLCHEEVGEPRSWDIGDQEFALAMTSMVALALEMQKRKLAEKRLEYKATHDDLTGLPNRSLLHDRIDQAIKRAYRHQKMMAILFIDLDHFKEINDSMGHKAGDMVLAEVSLRLMRSIRDSDTIARLGGDEFAIILEDMEGMEDVREIAEKLIDVLKTPIRIDTHELYVTNSIGISLYPHDGENSETLLRNADAAMYRAKKEGRNGYQYYTQEMTDKAFERLLMETQLRKAIERNEFVLYYQPQIDGRTGEITGAEGLIRWIHPDLGMVSPARFIHFAEETGLIVPIDRLVMHLGMQQMVQWYDRGLNIGVLSLNLTVRQLESDDFIVFLKALLDETGCKAEWIELEVTEGQIMKNPEQAITKLKDIADLGIRLAVDDFGTGYSSLAYLKRLPIHKLKIDQSFVRELPADEEDAAIVRAIIALAQSMRLDTIAEGVETAEQQAFLIEHGCHNIQGYLYAKPMKPEAMERWLCDRR